MMRSATGWRASANDRIDSDQNNFFVVHGDIALLRADFVLRDGDKLIASGSTAELVRKQADGSWLYVSTMRLARASRPLWCDLAGFLKFCQPKRGAVSAAAADLVNEVANYA